MTIINTYQDLPSYLRMEFKFAEICQEIYDNGIYFQKDLAYKHLDRLNKEIEEIDKILKPKFPNKFKELPPLKNVYKKNGDYTQAVSQFIASGQPYQFNQAGQMLRWKVEEGNLASASQLRDYMLSLGWKPRDDFDAWNYKKIKNPWGKDEIYKDDNGRPVRTTPKLPKSDLELEELAKISEDFKLISGRLVRGHRLHSIEGYLEAIRSDGRIGMKINSVGAATMRVTHSVVANIPKAEESKFFGKELRELFAATPGKWKVGCDVSGMEACMLAHYLGDQGFIDFILKENFKYHKFFHNFVQDYTGSLSATKNLGFAFVFGAGDQKLGSMCLNKRGDKKKLGEEVRNVLMKNVPNLNLLQEALHSQFEQYSGIIGLDGRIIPARKKFALINLACQSGGAIFAKLWTCIAHAEIKKQFPTAKIILFYHDELAYECDTQEMADKIGKILVASIKKAGEYLQLKIPMSGEYKVGKNWAEIH